MPRFHAHRSTSRSPGAALVYTLAGGAIVAQPTTIWAATGLCHAVRGQKCAAKLSDALSGQHVIGRTRFQWVQKSRQGRRTDDPSSL
eukprot:357650-Chlamydomonas_euryale.AAC.11